MVTSLTYGIVRETLPRERRVALTPDGAEQLIAAGHADDDVSVLLQWFRDD